MSVFDFSNYRSPSEARALEAQAFAERQLGAALANKRANTLALAQTAMQSEAQRNLEGYRTDNLNFQIGASARADQDRDREFGLRERQDKRAEDRYAAQMDAFKQDRALELAQRQSVQQNLDSIYNKLEAEKSALMKGLEDTQSTWLKEGTIIPNFETDAGARKKKEDRIRELEAAQEDMILNQYAPMYLTPGAKQAPTIGESFKKGLQYLGGMLSGGQGRAVAQQPQAKPPAFSGFAPSAAVNWTTTPPTQPTSQPTPLTQREIEAEKWDSLIGKLSGAGNLSEQPAGRPTGALAIPQGSGSYNPFMGRGLSVNPNPPNAGPIPYNAPTGALSAPKMAGDYNPFTGSTIAIKPPTKSKMQSALAAMADMYEQQGMAPEEALGQAYKDARTNSDLFRKTLSQ